MVQSLEHIVLREHSLVVSLREELLQLINDLNLIHLLTLLSLHDIAHIIDDARHLVLEPIAIILFYLTQKQLVKWSKSKSNLVGLS